LFPILKKNRITFVAPDTAIAVPVNLLLYGSPAGQGEGTFTHIASQEPCRTVSPFRVSAQPGGEADRRQTGRELLFRGLLLTSELAGLEQPLKRKIYKMPNYSDLENAVNDLNTKFPRPHLVLKLEKMVPIKTNNYWQNHDKAGIYAIFTKTEELLYIGKASMTNRKR